MNALEQYSKPIELLLKSFDEIELSTVNYFNISERLIQASQLKSLEDDEEYEYKLYKLVFCLHSFLSHLIELQKILYKKRTAVMYSIPRENSGHQTDVQLHYKRYKQNQNILKTHVESNIDLIFSHYPFNKEMYMLTEQLEELLHYFNKHTHMSVIFEEEVYPEPAPPLLNLEVVTKNRLNKENVMNV